MDVRQVFETSVENFESYDLEFALQQAEIWLDVVSCCRGKYRFHSEVTESLEVIDRSIQELRELHRQGGWREYPVRDLLRRIDNRFEILDMIFEPAKNRHLVTLLAALE